MKKLLTIGFLLLFYTQSFSQLNVSLRSNLPYNYVLSNIGGYVDSSGNEYALVGTFTGLSIVDVTNPTNPVVKFNIAGANSDWREVKTWQNYAYVTTEGCCNGLQILDLGYLPDSVPLKYYRGDGAINNQINTIHALHIDNGFCYLYGSDIFNGTALILDLADPWNPSYQGHTPGTYIHDGYVRNDTLYGCHINDGYFSVIDVTNKANPTIVTTQNTPSLFTHNSWLNDAGNVLFTTDEVNDSYLAAYDISDVNNITELGRIQVTPGSGSIIHNTHTLNDFEIVSWYKDGIAIIDVSRPNNMIVVGTYDTYPQGSGNGFNGCWGVYPYLPSGNLVCSDIDNGLFVLTPTYVRGCYLEGTVSDSISGIPINNAKIQILNTTINKQSKLTGEYKTGTAAAGVYDIQVSKAGYITKTFYGVNLSNGIVTNLDVQLASFTTVAATGTVTNAVTGAPIANAIVHFSNTLYDVTGTTNAAGQYTIAGFYPDSYTVTVGKWGFQTICLSSQVDATPLSYSLSPGYYDDFSLDFGWTVSGPSPNAWERGIPIQTNNQNAIANPGIDIFGDCGEQCYITDNGGDGPWDNDVDQGATILTSPVFDLSNNSNASLSYNRWFYNGGFSNGPPDDTLSIYLTNGSSTVLLERTYAGQPNQSTWLNQSYQIGSLIPLTASMRLILNISDPGPTFNIVEGGLDNFVISNLTGVPSTEAPIASISAHPNPFANNTQVNVVNNLGGKSTLLVYDALGKVVEKRQLEGVNNNLTLGMELKSGIYTLQLISSNGNSNTMKLVKE
jgi:choice-of-anchor B domain-containing protein